MVIVGLFVIAVLPMPYGYYISLRTMVCVALYFFWREVYPLRYKMAGWYYTLIGLFVLYNPVLMIHLENKFLWTCLNGLTLYLLWKMMAAIKDTPKS
jgi:hypothetical protein